MGGFSLAEYTNEVMPSQSSVGIDLWILLCFGVALLWYRAGIGIAGIGIDFLVFAT